MFGFAWPVRRHWRCMIRRFHPGVFIALGPFLFQASQMNRRQFLAGLLSSTALVKVSTPTIATDFGSGDTTVVWLSQGEWIAKAPDEIAKDIDLLFKALSSEFQIPERYLRGPDTLMMPLETHRYLEYHERLWTEAMNDAGYSLRSFPRLVEEAPTEVRRAAGWRRLAEFLKGGGSGQAQQVVSDAPEVEVDGKDGGG